MMAWNIMYVGSVELWLESLSKQQLKSIAKELRFLELSGSQLRLPHSKSLGKGLFELRERKYGYRVYYAFDQGKVIVLLQAGDKSSQKRDISIAREMLTTYRGDTNESKKF
jgi:putative addiction module killer protein